MKGFRPLTRWYGLMAIGLWVAPFAFSTGIMLISLRLGIDLAGPWLGLVNYGLWWIAALWSFSVTPWLSTWDRVSQEQPPAGRAVLGRWCISSAIGIFIALIPFTIFMTFVTLHVVRNGGLHELPRSEPAEFFVLTSLILGGGAILILLILRPLRKRQLAAQYRRLNWCYGCGYNLRGTDGDNCPECGFSLGVEHHAATP